MTDPTNPAPPAEELRPCPFCGAERGARTGGPRLMESESRQGWAVRCTRCMSRGSQHFMQSSAAEAWNKRAPDPALSVLTVENERMRAALERSDKFIGNYLSPWGSWKTAWWEGEVSDEMPFADDNALRRVGEIISAALSSLPAMKGEG